MASLNFYLHAPVGTVTATRSRTRHHSLGGEFDWQDIINRTSIYRKIRPKVFCNNILFSHKNVCISFLNHSCHLLFKYSKNTPFNFTIFSHYTVSPLTSPLLPLLLCLVGVGDGDLGRFLHLPSRRCRLKLPSCV